MKQAMRADLEIFLEFLIENHRAALRALGPKALGNLALARLARPDIGLLCESGGFGVGGRGCDGWLDGLKAQGLFIEGSSRHAG